MNEIQNVDIQANLVHENPMTRHRIRNSNKLIGNKLVILNLNTESGLSQNML